MSPMSFFERLLSSIDIAPQLFHRRGSDQSVMLVKEIKLMNTLVTTEGKNIGNFTHSMSYSLVENRGQITNFV